MIQTKIACILLTLFSTGPMTQNLVFSQEDSQTDESSGILDELSLGDLMSMTITTGSFLDLNLVKSPLSMTLITSEMVKTSGAKNMSELLEIFVPGFTYSVNKWNGTLWGMRGVTNDRNTKIIYLINGHKANSQSRDGFQSETVLGLLGDIERVEVLRGPAGLVYGTGAIAGIINVVTKKANGNKSNVSVSGATDGSKIVEANVYGTPAEDQQFNFSFGYKQSDGLLYDKVRVYGTAGWPGAPGFYLGAPTEGRWGSTDGNWKIAANWSNENTDIYIRATRQDEATTAAYIKDPWPNVLGAPSEGNVLIDGKRIDYNDPYWSKTENGGEARKIYRTDYLMAEINHQMPINQNNLKLKLSVDKQQSQTREDILSKYESNQDFLNGRVFETFGETRLNLATIFLLNSVEKLQTAFGIEYHLDHLGPDFAGKNERNSVSKHYIISDSYYNTFTLFGEGFYDFTDALGAHAGIRLDKHTRATMLNGKAALIVRPLENHSFKLIGQTASNNGTADNYEYSRNHVSDDGIVIIEPVGKDQNTEPTGPGYSIVQPTPPLDKMHELKPERVASLEVIWVGKFFDALTVEPSVALGSIKDLFGWSDTLYRVVNVGSYNYFNLDLDVKYESKHVKFGVNHTFQHPINTDPEKQKKTYYMYENIYDTTNGRQGWGEIDGYDIEGDTVFKAYYSQSKPVDLNVVKTQITYDGKHFLGLPDNMTKFYLTFSPLDWLSLSTTLRMFWGIPGMEKVVSEAKDNSNFLGYYHELDGQSLKDYFMRSVSKKLNLALNVSLPADFNVTLNFNNVLGTDNQDFQRNKLDKNTINTLRKSAVYYTNQRDLYSMDQRSVGFTLTKNF
jgi:outer membrane receptor protein involved in Fe transport